MKRPCSDAVLFNGGFFIPDICQQRVADVMERWYGRRPAILENRDLDLAVAVGAAYYSYVKATGAGLLVRGGLPRSYYVGIGDNEAVCLVPRGAEEGQTLELDSQDLHLVANKPVSFRLYSSLTRVDDPVGHLVGSAEGADLHLHAPLNAVIRFGKAGERLVPVKLRAHLTEVGTLPKSGPIRRSASTTGGCNSNCVKLANARGGKKAWRRQSATRPSRKLKL